MMPEPSNDRRGFLQRLMSAAGLAAAPAAAQAAPQNAPAAGPRDPAHVHASAELQIAEAIELRPDGRESRFLDHSGRRSAGGLQRAGTGRHHSHLVYDFGARRRPFERAGAARLLGRQCQAERRDAGRGFLRAESEFVLQLRIAVPGVLAGEIVELLFRDAVPPLGAIHSHQRRQTGGRGPSIRISTTRLFPRCPTMRSISTRNTGKMRRASR